MLKWSHLRLITISFVMLISPLVAKSEPEYLVTKSVRVGKLIIDYRFHDKESQLLEAKISHIISQAFEHFSQLFNGHPRDLNANEYHKIKVKVNYSDRIGGEADPQFIELTLSNKELFGYASWETVLIHEVFHLWNAESFRYKDGSEQWFNEGVSDFYAFQTAAAFGIHSPSEALHKAALPIAYYTSSSKQHPLSMRKAGKSKKSKIENYFLVYNGGWVTAMVLDFQIREQTQGKKSLDDLMRWLYKNFPRDKKKYELSDIKAGLKLTTGNDFSDFFKRYIEGSETIPVDAYFDIGKASWAYEFEKSSATSKPNQTHNTLYQVLGIYPK